MIMPKNQYRIVKDSYGGYEVQIKKWWFPFGWRQCDINTHTSIKKAEEYAMQHSIGNVILVRYLGKLPKEEVIYV